MTWFRVDDTLAGHQKVRAAGLPAMGLWVVAGAHCSQQLTDGFVPEWFVVSLAGGKKCAAALVAAGLWTDVEGGWQFHDWEQANPSRESVMAEREKAKDRQKAWRLRHRDSPVSNGRSNAVTNGVTNSVSNAAPTRPDPTRPISTETSSLPRPASRASNAKTAMTDDWWPDDLLIAWAKKEAALVNVERETANFVDYFVEKGEKRPGWARSWKRWMRDKQEKLEKQTRPAEPEWKRLGRMGDWDV